MMCGVWIEEERLTNIHATFIQLTTIRTIKLSIELCARIEQGAKYGRS